jgi:hypothetical protein
MCMRVEGEISDLRVAFTCSCCHFSEHGAQCDGIATKVLKEGFTIEEVRTSMADTSFPVRLAYGAVIPRPLSYSL